MNPQTSSIIGALDPSSNDLVTSEELVKAEKLIEIQAAKAKEKDRDAKEDQLRQMAWLAMLSMLFFTVALFMPFIPDSRIVALDNLIQMFYIAQAGVVASFFGSNAYMSRNN
jgi:hypothetical protein